jgi:hypothetical protein
MCSYILDHNKMLASTMQHSTHHHTRCPVTTTHQPAGVRKPETRMAREQHQPVSSQDPTVCELHRSTPLIGSMRSTQPRPPTSSRRSRICERRNPDPSRPESALTTEVRLLRKEVIQPHLPVRLPCYDFVPIASPTFDDSLPQGVGPPASGVTNFRDVTGGVYKARERIHRSNADLRLLATPTSRGRVADPDPN